MSKLLIQMAVAWIVSLASLSAASVFWTRSTEGRDSGFVEGMLGLGIVLLIPSLVFAAFIATPFMAYLTKQNIPILLIPLIAAGGLALIMWLLSVVLLPTGWQGAGTALIAYAAVLGLIYGGLHILVGGRTI